MHSTTTHYPQAPTAEQICQPIINEGIAPRKTLEHLPSQEENGSGAQMQSKWLANTLTPLKPGRNSRFHLPNGCITIIGAEGVIHNTHVYH